MFLNISILKGCWLPTISEILKTGVYGVAVATAITKDFNTITLFKKILEKSDIEEQVWKPKQTV